MRVLVTAATKHGATTGIAEAIGETLRSAGLDVAVTPPDEVESLDGYDAVVLGSAVYMGRWLDPAKEFVERHAEALAERPVWLFSSGPLGDPPKPTEEPVDAEPLRDQLHARDHQVFAGRLDRGLLGFAEKAIASVVRAPEGDFRAWEDVGAWATTIVAQLRDEVAAGS